MNIYVATKWENMERAKEIAAQLEAAGHNITYKWWKDARFDRSQAWQDYKGVVTANALVLIVEKDLPYSGALTEFGIAIGRGIPVYIMGNAIDRNIFTLMPHVHRGIETLLQATYPVNTLFYTA